MKAKHYQSTRLFNNTLLEALTHVHPATPIIIWGPVVAMLFYSASADYHQGPVDFALWGLGGLFIWTLTEYLMHRFVFHYNAKGRVGKYLVYLFHGIHHDEPDDPTRLVMPPAPAIIFVTLFYFGFGLVLPTSKLHLFMAWFLVGYLIYDYIHYGTHHWPMKSKVGTYLRKYHLRHHHAKEHSKYGVSNPFWDYVFTTVTGPKKEIK